MYNIYCSSENKNEAEETVNVDNSSSKESFTDPTEIIQTTLIPDG